MNGRRPKHDNIISFFLVSRQRRPASSGTNNKLKVLSRISRICAVFHWQTWSSFLHSGISIARIFAFLRSACKQRAQTTAAAVVVAGMAPNKISSDILVAIGEPPHQWPPWIYGVIGAILTYQAAQHHFSISPLFADPPVCVRWWCAFCEESVLRIIYYSQCLPAVGGALLA